MYRLSYTCFILLLETKKFDIWGLATSIPIHCPTSEVTRVTSKQKLQTSSQIPQQNIKFFILLFLGLRSSVFYLSCQHRCPYVTSTLSVSSPALPLILFWEQIVRSDRAHLNTCKIDLLLFSTITVLSEILKGTPNVWTMLKLQNVFPILQFPVFNWQEDISHGDHFTVHRD